jgi:SAM-dependent methyltransferase
VYISTGLRVTRKSTIPLVDAEYYEAVPPGSLAGWVLRAARNRIYRDFIRVCAPLPRHRILDVGVSDIVNDVANLLERKYPYPERITAVGLGLGHHFQAAFPAVTYVRHEANQPLPFADDTFDIVASNAVLEHVGSPNRQAQFLRELMRVAPRMFVSVPNRYFPVEHHTAIPVLHFSDASFRSACRCLGKGKWAEEHNLILISKHRLASLAPPGIESMVGYTGLMLGPFSSNLFLFADRSQPRF